MTDYIAPPDITQDLVSKEADGPSAINWTTVSLTVGFFPAFVAFQQAITESINYSLPTPNSGIVWVAGLQNSSYVQCYAPVSTPARVGWAWGVFALLMVFGFIWMTITVYIHAHYYDWRTLIRNPDDALTRGERLAKKALARQLTQQQRKKVEDDSDTEDESLFNER